MNPFHKFKVGNFTCYSLIDMHGPRDMWATFPTVPKDQLQAALDEGGYSADWVRHGNVLLIDTGKYKVLVDAGLPTEGGGLLVSSLEAAGFSPDDIDVVMITHGDGDHIGGLANYTKARIVMPEDSYRLWTEDTEGMLEEFLRLLRDNMNVVGDQLAAARNGRLAYPNSFNSFKNRLDLVQPEDDILPGIRFVAAPGHRRDHFAVEVHSEGETLLHIVDAFRHPIQCKHPDFPSLFDSYPDILAKTTHMLMGRAADKNALVFGAHLWAPGLVRIEREADSFVWLDLRS